MLMAKLDWVRAVMYFMKHTEQELEEMNNNPDWEYKQYYQRYKYNTHD